MGRILYLYRTVHMRETRLMLDSCSGSELLRMKHDFCVGFAPYAAHSVSTFHLHAACIRGTKPRT